MAAAAVAMLPVSVSIVPSSATAGSSLASVTRGVLAPTAPAPAVMPACPATMFTFARSLSSQSSITARLVAAPARLPPDSSASADVFRFVPALAVTVPVTVTSLFVPRLTSRPSVAEPGTTAAPPLAGTAMPNASVVSVPPPVSKSAECTVAGKDVTSTSPMSTPSFAANLPIAAVPAGSAVVSETVSSPAAVTSAVSVPSVIFVGNGFAFETAVFDPEPP